MSLSEDAVRGVTTNTAPEVSKAVTPPLTFAERYARDTPYPHPVREYLAQMRKRWLWEQENPLGSERNPLTLLVPAWVERIAVEQGTTSQEWATNTYRPYVVDVTVLGAYE